jgi:hypothetical protein
VTRRLVPELLLALLAVACAWPLFVVDHPPIQDLPQHLAAMRVLVDYHDPALRFAEFFEVDLLRTQYLAYYGVVRVLGTGAVRGARQPAGAGRRHRGHAVCHARACCERSGATSGCAC